MGRYGYLEDEEEDNDEHEHVHDVVKEPEDVSTLLSSSWSLVSSSHSSRNHREQQRPYYGGPVAPLHESHSNHMNTTTSPWNHEHDHHHQHHDLSDDDSPHDNIISPDGNGHRFFNHNDERRNQHLVGSWYYEPPLPTDGYDEYEIADANAPPERSSRKLFWMSCMVALFALFCHYAGPPAPPPPSRFGEGRHRERQQPQQPQYGATPNNHNQNHADDHEYSTQNSFHKAEEEEEAYHHHLLSSWSSYLTIHGTHLISSCQALFLDTPVHLTKWLLVHVIDHVKEQTTHKHHQHRQQQLHPWWDLLQQLLLRLVGGISLQDRWAFYQSCPMWIPHDVEDQLLGQGRQSQKNETQTIKNQNPFRLVVVGQELAVEQVSLALLSWNKQEEATNAEFFVPNDDNHQYRARFVKYWSRTTTTTSSSSTTSSTTASPAMDPLWLYLVGPASTGKTTLVEALHHVLFPHQEPQCGTDTSTGTGRSNLWSFLIGHDKDKNKNHATTTDLTNLLTIHGSDYADATATGKSMELEGDPATDWRAGEPMTPRGADQGSSWSSWSSRSTEERRQGMISHMAQRIQAFLRRRQGVILHVTDIDVMDPLVLAWLVTELQTPCGAAVAASTSSGTFTVPRTTTIYTTQDTTSTTATTNSRTTLWPPGECSSKNKRRRRSVVVIMSSHKTGTSYILQELRHQASATKEDASSSSSSLSFATPLTLRNSPSLMADIRYQVDGLLRHTRSSATTTTTSTSLGNVFHAVAPFRLLTPSDMVDIFQVQVAHYSHRERRGRRRGAEMSTNNSVGVVSWDAFQVTQAAARSLLSPDRIEYVEWTGVASTPRNHDKHTTTSTTTSNKRYIRTGHALRDDDGDETNGDQNNNDTADRTLLFRKIISPSGAHVLDRRSGVLWPKIHAQVIKCATPHGGDLDHDGGYTRDKPATDDAKQGPPRQFSTTTNTTTTTSSSNNNTTATVLVWDTVSSLDDDGTAKLSWCYHTEVEAEPTCVEACRFLI